MAEATQQRTPWHVWAVGVLLTLWAAFGALDYVATVTNFEPYMSQFTDAFRAYFAGLPLWLYVIWGVSNACGLLGAIALLLRRRIAAPLLTIAISGTVASLICGVVSPPPESPPGSAVMALLITALAVSAPIYAFWLQRRGVLR